MTMTAQESFGQTIDKLLAQAMQEHKTFSLQISINPMQQAEIQAISETPSRKERTDFSTDIDDIFMVGLPGQS